MSKILISWMAKENDFLKNGDNSVNESGPNFGIHKFHYNYDKHLLLTTSKIASDDTKYQHLVNALRTTFKHTIVEVALDIENKDTINIDVIYQRVCNLLLKNKQHQIDIFVSTGTSTMQVAWYLSHMSLRLNTNLFQLRRPEHSKSGISEKVSIHIEKSDFYSYYLVQEKVEDNTNVLLNLKSLKTVKEKAKKIASVDKVGVLITGETGTGKEVWARYIQENSIRKNKPFISINCSAINDQLLESRLFGYVKGAFTGADKDTPGVFEIAHGGTLFLDEIGDISPYMQQSLLRFFPNGEILPVGATETKNVDVRIIAATNKNILNLSSENQFRTDLFYRLAICELELPPFRTYEKEDKISLINFLKNKSTLKLKLKDKGISQEALNILLNNSFPGNIRELENLIEKALVESNDEIEPHHFPSRILFTENLNNITLISVIKNHIFTVYKRNNFDIRKTMSDLSISRNTILKYINNEK